MAELDNAIPEHLRCQRSKPTKTPSDFAPAYPSYTVRFPKNAEILVMAIIGLQYRSTSNFESRSQPDAPSKVTALLKSDRSPPSFSEWAAVTDSQGFYNIVAFAYWPSKEQYEAWASGSGFKTWWEQVQPDSYGHGLFLELFFPSVDRLETIFNTKTPEGFGHLRDSWSGEVQQHAYWGSMRDRLAAAQTDDLTGDVFETPSKINTNGIQEQRVRVSGKNNLTVIRSGQDWLGTTPEERKLYLETMHPVLIKGMDFLRDKGEEVGCYNCRFFDIVSSPSQPKADQDRTFGLAYLNDLASLESWCKDHCTHLAIFREFFQYARKLNNNLTLRVFHEVLVVKREQQFFEYVGCHPGTGMLKGHS